MKTLIKPGYPVKDPDQSLQILKRIILLRGVDLFTRLTSYNVQENRLSVLHKLESQLNKLAVTVLITGNGKDRIRLFQRFL